MTKTSYDGGHEGHFLWYGGPRARDSRAAARTSRRARASYALRHSVESFRSRMAAFATFLIVLIVLVMFRPDAIMSIVHGAEYAVNRIYR